MNDAQIELTYTALAECIARVGQAKTSLLLATLSLELLTLQPDVEGALQHIRQAERLTQL